MPKLAVFPKAFMHAWCKDGSMKISEWIKVASALDVDGLEWYAGFLEMNDEKNWKTFRTMTEDTGKTIPMMCCSPDFTHPDKKFREQEIEKENIGCNKMNKTNPSHGKPHGCFLFALKCQGVGNKKTCYDECNDRQCIEPMVITYRKLPYIHAAQAVNMQVFCFHNLFL